MSELLELRQLALQSTILVYDCSLKKSSKFCIPLLILEKTSFFSVLILSVLTSQKWYVVMEKLSVKGSKSVLTSVLDIKT